MSIEIFGKHGPIIGLLKASSLGGLLAFTVVPSMGQGLLVQNQVMDNACTGDLPAEILYFPDGGYTPGGDAGIRNTFRVLDEKGKVVRVCRSSELSSANFGQTTVTVNASVTSSIPENGGYQSSGYSHADAFDSIKVVSRTLPEGTQVTLRIERAAKWRINGNEFYQDDENRSRFSASGKAEKWFRSTIDSAGSKICIAHGDNYFSDCDSVTEKNKQSWRDVETIATFVGDQVDIGQRLESMANTLATSGTGLQVGADGSITGSMGTRLCALTSGVRLVALSGHAYPTGHLCD